MSRPDLEDALRTWLLVVPALLLALSGCASGPSAEALINARPPSTTTTTEPPPEGVIIVRIANASFKPANLEMDLDTHQIIRWENEDDREYVVLARNKVDGEPQWQSPPLNQGDSWELDLSQYEPAVHRYFMTLGAQTIPGLIDTRPSQ